MVDNRPIVDIDTETKCLLDLSEVGTTVYLNHPTADLLMFSYVIGSSPAQLWLPGDELPIFMRKPQAFRFAAFNASFDYRVLNKFSKRYGYQKIQLDQMIDIMAVAARFGLPQSLDRLGKALKVKMLKLATGTKLKNVCCCHPQKCTPIQWEQFKEYSIRDAACLHEIRKKLPVDHLSDSEQEIWLATQRQNYRGLPVDTWSIKQINRIVDYYTEQQSKRVPYITGGEVQTIGQIKKITEWCSSKGVFMDNLQTLTVENTVHVLKEKLESGDVVGTDYQKVYDLLRVRQLIGGAAVKKYKRLLKMAFNGWIHDNIRYHGAGTGRTTGGGFQMLNLPRAKIKPGDDETYEEAVEKVLKTFFDTSVLKHPDPLLQAKKLIRPMIKAPKDKTLIVADWSSIEYILLMYFSGQWDQVKAFANGADPYKLFATELFNVRYEDVTSDQRQESKPPVLGSGYMLGWKGLIAYAEGYGVKMTVEQAKFATNTYRETHPRVVAAWHGLRHAAMNAVTWPGTKQDAIAEDKDIGWRHDLNTSFIVSRDRTGRPWLIMTLPSGRNLYYCQPQIVPGKYGDEIAHMGVNPYTKQWGKVYFRPQRMIENVIQGLGRDILTDAYARLEQKQFVPVIQVYDEIGCLTDVVGAEQKLKEMVVEMCISPSWMPKLPLRADGYISQRYKKD